MQNDTLVAVDIAKDGKPTTSLAFEAAFSSGWQGSINRAAPSSSRPNTQMSCEDRGSLCRRGLRRLHLVVVQLLRSGLVGAGPARPPESYGPGGGVGEVGGTASDECQCVHFQLFSSLRRTTELRDGCDIMLPSGMVALKSNSTVQ